MSLVEQLGIALGLAAVAGVNLYLTTLVLGLAFRFGGFDPAGTPIEALGVLADSWVISISAALFLIEFVADKVPWLDSVWDGIHALVRPLGGALLTYGAMAELPPTLLVTAVLLGGSASLATHGTKSGLRLLLNFSPEPVSNIAASVTEDGLVLGGLGLIAFAPVLAFFVFLVVCIACAALSLAIWRRVFRRRRVRATPPGGALAS